MNKGMSEEDAKAMLAYRDAQAKRLMNLRASGATNLDKERREVHSGVDFYTKHLGTNKGNIKDQLSTQRNLAVATRRINEQNANFVTSKPKPVKINPQKQVTPQPGAKILTKADKVFKNIGIGATAAIGTAGLAYGGYRLYKKRKEKDQQTLIQ